jgi:Transposase DDE domain
MPNCAEILKQKFQQSLGLPLAELEPETVIANVLAQQEIKVRQTLYNPVVTLWAWLAQVLDADKSMNNTVKRLVAWLAASGVVPPSTDTGAYSKARERLPLASIEQLLRLSAEVLQEQVQPSQLWCGHSVKAYDATTLTLMDTSANQAAFPQPSSQKVGCGLPLVKLVVWFSVASGALLQVAIAAFNISEWELSRQLYATLQPEDVVVADSAYGTYVDLALVQQYGAHGVYRKHHARGFDFRRGKRLAQGDHIVTWQRPTQCPRSMLPQVFLALPETLQVREIEIQVEQAGFRPQRIILVTTLLDAKRYCKAQLAKLYRLRWHSTEVNLRHLKTTLKMEMIFAKTPEIARKDIWIHLLAYNLLRRVMQCSVQAIELDPLNLSLQGTRQMLHQFLTPLALANRREHRRLYEMLLQLVAAQLVPIRPNRVEPRMIKRRPKNFPRMQFPRSVLKARLVA